MHRTPRVSWLTIGLIALLLAAPVSAANPASPTSGTPASASTEPLTMFRGDAARTGTMPGPGPVDGPSFIWRYNFHETFPATPAIGDGMVIVHNSANLIALDQATGEEIWNVPLSGSYSSPLVANGMVYVGTGGEGFKAFDASTGAEVWTYHTGDEPIPEQPPPDIFDSSPTIVDGILYVGGGPYGGLFALDPATGAERWRFDTHGGTFTAPAVVNGVVYIATDTQFDAIPDDATASALYAVDAGTGKSVWTFALPPGQLSYSTPSVSNGLVVFGATDNFTQTSAYYAVDAATGTERWHVDSPKPTWDGSPGSNGTLFFLPMGEGNQLLAVDTSGKTAWAHDTKGPLFGGPMNTGDMVYILDEAGVLAALDAGSGDVRLTLDIGPGGSPAIIDGRLYVTGGPVVYALGNADDPAALTLASQPDPPASGPGSDDTRFPAAHGTHYGTDPGGYWIWEPATADGSTTPVAEGPLPVLLYLSRCCGNGEWPTPEEVDPWLTHLARQGYVIIAPVYSTGIPENVVTESKRRLKAALSELEKPGHAQVDLTKFGVIGYSYGGVPAVQYAADAEASGLPVPQALFLTAPCVANGFCLDMPLEKLEFPDGMKAIVIGYEDDNRIGLEEPMQVYSLLTSLPAADRQFIEMKTDIHGQPPIIANHETTFQQVDAADWYGIWKLSDALFACVFAGEWCEYASGDTLEQRAMGVWSDGVPAIELVINSDLGTPAATPAP